MDREHLAKLIREGMEAMGYELVLRQMAPRTGIAIRNQVERSQELAREIERRLP